MSESADYPDYDEYRPAKKMKLDTSLSTTMDTQEEVLDDDEGWDEIYGATSAAATAEINDTSATAAHVTGDGSLPVAVPTEPSMTSVRQSEDHEVLDATTTTCESAVNGDKLDVTTMPQSPPSAPDAADATHTAHAPDTATTANNSRVRDAEWSFDSSDESTDDSLSSDSDDDDDGSEEDYPLLDPITAAKILMADDGDDEDTGDKKDKTNVDHQPRTTNEMKEDVVPRPDIEITPDMQITLLGTIDNIVENAVLIRGNTSGEYQVLEPGSVLCTHDRKVVGVVADLFGRVQQPMYSVLFSPSQEELLHELQLTPGAEISYVNSHSKFVFTEPLRGKKGTDASNIYDEEVGEDEMEFSDDEQEAEYKRQRKLAKKSGRGALSREAFNDGVRIDTRTRGAPGQASASYINRNETPTVPYPASLNYDDTGTGDALYEPLKRPDNLAQLMAAPAPRGSSDRGRDRGRGDRGRGRGRGDRMGGRGDRSRGRGAGQRGGFNRESGRGSHAQQYRSNNQGLGATNAYTTAVSAVAQSTAYAPQQNQYMQPQAAQTYQFNGYTFQHGTGVTQAPSAQPDYAYYSSTPQVGAYVNPAFYGNTQQQQQQHPQQHQPAWQAAPPGYAQQFAMAQNGQTAYSVSQQPVATAGAPYTQAPAYTAAQQQELAEVMRRLGHYTQPH